MSDWKKINSELWMDFDAFSKVFISQGSHDGKYYIEAELKESNDVWTIGEPFDCEKEAEKVMDGYFKIGTNSPPR